MPRSERACHDQTTLRAACGEAPQVTKGLHGRGCAGDRAARHQRLVGRHTNTGGKGAGRAGRKGACELSARRDRLHDFAGRGERPARLSSDRAAGLPGALL